LLGIDIMNSSSTATKSGNSVTDDNNNRKYVFLYYTESKDGQLRNMIYRYNWNGQNQSFIDPALILDLPALPGPNHDGGKLVIGPDNYLYAVIGDLNHRGKLQNIKDGPDPDNTPVILRVNPDDGSAAKENPFMNNANPAMHKYYAYGIRNSFGITFDPLTHSLWQTENGPDVFDEINIVKLGFNSGWIQLMGPLSRNTDVNTNRLVNYPWSYYANPVFSWKDPVAVTAIEFMKSSVLGQKYKNNIFVGDYNNGNLYYFEVNNTRTGIKLDPSEQQLFSLSDLVVDNSNQLSAIAFGNGFGGITDIKTGPADGILYVLSINDGNIYKVVPFTKK
jgi:glucose/arabinose dehydrogenase